MKVNKFGSSCEYYDLYMVEHASPMFPNGNDAAEYEEWLAWLEFITEEVEVVHG